MFDMIMCKHLSVVQALWVMQVVKSVHASETRRQLEGFCEPIRRAQKQDAIYLVYLGTTDRSFRRSAGIYQQTLRYCQTVNYGSSWLWQQTAPLGGHANMKQRI
jgi:hypothetical protein